MRLVWTREGWEDYLHWQSADRKLVKRSNALIREALRDPYHGTGKPEVLKYGSQGSISRRITEEHRLVYRIEGDDLVVLQARYHY